MLGVRDTERDFTFALANSHIHNCPKTKLTSKCEDSQMDIWGKFQIITYVRLFSHPLRLFCGNSADDITLQRLSKTTSYQNSTIWIYPSYSDEINLKSFLPIFLHQHSIHNVAYWLFPTDWPTKTTKLIENYKGIVKRTKIEGENLISELWDMLPLMWSKMSSKYITNASLQCSTFAKFQTQNVIDSFLLSKFNFLTA